MITKRNDILINGTTGMSLEHMLSKERYTQKTHIVWSKCVMSRRGTKSVVVAIAWRDRDN